MGLYEGLASELKDQVITDLKKALPEKERELQQIREHQFQNGYREAEAIWEEKYQQLMAQAVRFATACDSHYRPTNDVVAEAQAFLREHL